MRRAMIAGMAAAGAATAALVIYVDGEKTDSGMREAQLGEATPSEHFASAPATENSLVCLQTDFALIKGFTRGCHSPAEIEAMRDMPVLAADAKEIAVALSHPTDVNVAPIIVHTCADYDRLAGEGWFAETSVEIAREQFFKRSCGVLAALISAKPASITYFSTGLADDADIRSMINGTAFSIGETPAGAGVEFAIEELSSGVWRAQSTQLVVTVQQLAHADFNGDGVGDILAYANLRANDGTAQTGMVGLMEKTVENGPCRFLPE